MIPLYSTKQIREVDEFAIGRLGVPGIVLMENAAVQIFEITCNEILSRKKIKKIGAVCGKGNNGGDGFAVLRHFANKGFPVTAVHIGDEDEMSQDCKINFNILKKMSEENSEITIRKFNSLKDLNLLADSDIIFDAMLGSGTKGGLAAPIREIVESLNKMKTVRAAIDIPTGLDADTGSSQSPESDDGEIIFNADLTITLGEFKKGLFFQDGYANCGKVIKGEVGIDPLYYDKISVSDFLIEPEDVFEFLPGRGKSAHKYSAGKVFTIAGSGNFPGAAALTSKSALKAGAGSSILAFPKSARKLVHKKISEVVVQSYEDNDKEFLSSENIPELNAKLKWADVCAIGPGLGRNEETMKAVLKVLEERKCQRFVIDADAIFALGNGEYEKLDLENFVLTPHHGEFANLIGINVSELEKDLLSYGRKFVSETGCFLVMKGAPSIIFIPGGEALINSAGNPGMAKFGTGDVLTGVIAGMMAQQFKRKSSEDIKKAVVSGVYLHSLAADLLLKNFTEYSYTAEDIIKSLPAAFKFIRRSFA